ncbi:tyrosine-type recombinase/integrase, partial [Schaalia sp. lx-100]|uniref:tyrosine-type recombinase/integrase n=1 Tax=Schaalia sp. lx-100 TaxID=2899081 RepID=UPI001E541463
MTPRRDIKLPTGISMYKGLYRVRITVDGRQEFVGKYVTLTEARAALDIARAQKITGSFESAHHRREKREKAREALEAEEARKITVAQWAAQWIVLVDEQWESGLMARATRRDYQSTLELYILPVLGDIPLSEVTPDDVKKMADSALSRSAHTRTKVLVHTRRMFNVALERGVGGLSVNPVKEKLNKPKDSPTMRRYYAMPAEVKALAEAMPSELALTVYLGFYCELRQGEVLGLQRGDFMDLDVPVKAHVRVDKQWNQKEQPPRLTPTKARDTRVLHIPEALIPVIVAHMENYCGEASSDFIFPSSKDPSRPTSQSTHNRHWIKARKSAGIPPAFRFHDLRASGLTLYAQQGATVAEIMARGGHRDVGVAMRYQRAAAE